MRNADLFVIQRMLPCPGTVNQTMDGIYKMGTPIIYEVDDLLMEMPPTNPNRDFAMQCRPFVLDVMQKAAAITVSTEALKTELLRWNPNIYVLPNLIDERLWSQTQQPHAGPVVIGFTGTSTHGDDLRMIEDAFIQISAKHGQRVAFQFMGCTTDRLARLPGAKLAEFTPDYESFARALQTTPMDIAVVSLEDNLFNRCKSNIKWLEYSACGIAGVYSDLPPYNSCIRHGQTGLLVGNRVHDWFQAIDTLVTNASLRRAISPTGPSGSSFGLHLSFAQSTALCGSLSRAFSGRTASSRLRWQQCPQSRLSLKVGGSRSAASNLEQAVAQEPHLQSVVERVNRALSLGRTQMAARIVQKELGHRTEAARSPGTAGRVAIDDGVVKAMK